MRNMLDQITIKKLDSKEQMLLAFPIIRQRYKEMTLENFDGQISEMIARNDFKMLGAFIGDEIVGVTGYWISRMLYCGRYIQISNFIVDRKKRGLGIGGKILHEIENLAKELQCEKIVLDSFTENKKSHPLYFKENFYIRGFHFMKDL